MQKTPNWFIIVNFLGSFLCYALFVSSPFTQLVHDSGDLYIVDWIFGGLGYSIVLTVSLIIHGTKRSKGGLSFKYWKINSAVQWFLIIASTIGSNY